MKKKFSILFFLLFLSLGIANPTFAQTTQTIQSAPSFNYSPGVKNTLHNFTQQTMIEVLSSAVCLLSGTDPITHNKTCLGIDSKTGTLGINKNAGINSLMANSMDSVYTSFPHTSDYIAYLQHSFHGAAGHAYAASGAGLGYQGLLPMINIWVALRNVAYLFITLAFMIIGIAIMLRVKIDPRTVMTIENQLPKLIIGLILITFSFAIAGFLIDLMYVLINFMYSIATTIPNTNFKDLSPTVLQNSTPWDAVKALVPARSLALNTGNANLFGVNFSFPSFAPIIDNITSTVGNIPLLGGVIAGALKIGFGLLTFGVKLFIPGSSLDMNAHKGFGYGISDLAAGAAISFGDVLKAFFKIDQTVPVDATTSPLLFIGLNWISALGLVSKDLQNGSPITALIDIASSVVSFSLARGPADWAANMGINIGGQGLTFGGNFGINLGTVFAAPTFGAFYALFFNLIDGVLRTMGINILVYLVVYLAVFLATARLLFSLVFAWATSLFQIAMGPVSIALGLIPGAKGFGFSSWLKGLAANLLAFPITIGILLLGSALVQAFDIAPGQTAQPFFVPPLIGGNQLPVGLLMALSVIFAASNGPQIAKDMLEEKDNKNFGAFGETSGASMQALYKAGKAVTYGFGKTPQPGARGGVLAGFGQF